MSDNFGYAQAILGQDGAARVREIFSENRNDGNSDTSSGSAPTIANYGEPVSPNRELMMVRPIFTIWNDYRTNINERRLAR